MNDNELKRLCAVAYESPLFLSKHLGGESVLQDITTRDISQNAHRAMQIAVEWEGQYPREKVQAYFEEYARDRSAATARPNTYGQRLEVLAVALYQVYRDKWKSPPWESLYQSKGPKTREQEPLLTRDYWISRAVSVLEKMEPGV